MWGGIKGIKQTSVVIPISEYNELISRKVLRKLRADRPTKEISEQKEELMEALEKLNVAKADFYKDVNDKATYEKTKLDLAYIIEEQVMWTAERKDMQEMIVDLQNRSILRMIFNKYLGG